MMDPEGEFQIRVDGIANITGDRAFIIAVVRLEAEVDHELLIYAEAEKEMEVQVYPGQRSYMEILLRNQGDIIDDLTLKIMEHQSSWDARFQDEENSFMVTLPPGSSDSIFITRILIGVPETSKVGDSQTISIYSTSEMYSRYEIGKSTDRIDLVFRVVNPSTISIHPKKAMEEAESGSQLDLQFDLVHTGVPPFHDRTPIEGAFRFLRTVQLAIYHRYRRFIDPGSGRNEDCNGPITSTKRDLGGF